jgi:hypothetical protein
MVIVAMVVGHGVANRGASNSAHHRADRPSDNRPNGGAADPARDSALFVSQGKTGRGAEYRCGGKNKKFS